MSDRDDAGGVGAVPIQAVGFAMSLIHIAIVTTEKSQHNPPLRATERHAIDPEYRRLSQLHRNQLHGATSYTNRGL